ncbi:MAG: HpcH/HpaI aldolase/citrate lyase family protein [Candidatus Poribacteria bacterium]
MKTNPVKQKLKEGGVCLGHIVMEFASPGLVTMLANAQFDFVLFDTEHTRFSIETIGEMIRYARSAGLPAIVRVPRGQHDQMSRIMDAGANGIMAPNVQSRAEAESIIQATKYAPLGNRGTAFGIAHDDFELGDVLQKITQANEQTLIIAQIESVSGVENVEAILGVEGVDVGWIGHFDLTQSMGIPGQFEHPDYLKAVEKVIVACQHQGKAGGFMGANPNAVLELVRKGFRCVAYGSDIGIYRAALTDGLQEIRQHLQ